MKLGCKHQLPRISIPPTPTKSSLLTGPSLSCNKRDSGTKLDLEGLGVEEEGRDRVGGTQSQGHGWAGFLCTCRVVDQIGGWKLVAPDVFYLGCPVL